MLKSKRSVLSPERNEILSQPGTTYIISCYRDEYFCNDHLDNHCARGFFSLYLQAVYGIFFAKKLNLPYFVDFGNLIYCYSDKEKFNNNQNFWEYYFEQKPIDSQAHLVLNLRYENYPLKIWNRKFIKELHELAVADIKPKKELAELINNIKKQFEGLRILGIHIRKTDHHLEAAPVNDHVYFNLVNKQIHSFDKLFIATDDDAILQSFKERYPEKAICNPFIRSSGGVSLHRHMVVENRYVLGQQALLDCYTLSCCTKVILGPSNLSYCVLLLNPEIVYQLAESWEEKFKRQKTLIVFLLNKWGIRKW